VALPVDEEGRDQVAAQARSVGGVELREADAIEAGEALLGSDPDITVGGLNHRMKGELGQPFLPGVEPVLGERLPGIEGRCGSSDAQARESARDEEARPDPGGVHAAR
jgi:hypothetical protein